MISTITLTSGDVQLFTTLLVLILLGIGWIGRQQIRWMGRIEDKVNELDKRTAIIEALTRQQSKIET